MANTSALVQMTRFLEVYEDSYVLSSTQFKDQVRINLATGELRKEIRTTGEAEGVRPTRKEGIIAIYGICQLENSKYLIAVTKALTIGSVYNRNIQQISEMTFYPINSTLTMSHEDQKQIGMMQSLFLTKMFYFSDEYDLTNSFHQFIKNKADKNYYNSNFCYNECYISDFIKSGCHEWISPFINGFVCIEYVQIDDSQINFILVSRRDKRRAGMRFISRGTDLDGNPSNMAEQEQIIVITKGQFNNIYSFVQTRGSMPFQWTQKPNIQWAPSGVPVGSEQENLSYCRKHFEDQEKLYQRQVIVNLIDKKGKTQLGLGNYFEKMVEQLNNKNLKYVWFDFHHECRKMKYENLQKLIDICKEDLQEIGYFELSYAKDKIETPKINRLQKGTLRTNCMDCLDRTNVAQTVIARNVLHSILLSASITDKAATTAFEKLPGKLEEIFRNNWTKNADVLSILYTGTGALKTDFTRTGKRTPQGAIQDGVNSVQRYFYGNFFDGQRQDCLDLLLGKIRPQEQQIKPKLNPIIYFLFVALIVPFLVKGQIDSALVNVSSEGSITSSFLGLVSLAIGIIIAIKSLLGFPNYFVSQPTLPQ